MKRSVAANKNVNLTPNISVKLPKTHEETPKVAVTRASFAEYILGRSL